MTQPAQRSTRVIINADNAQDAARVERRVAFTLARIGGETFSPSFQICRQRDPSGSRLFQFRVRLRLRDGRWIDIQESQADLDHAADRALDRAQRALLRRTPMPV